VSENGYAGEILKVDLSDGNISSLSTAVYADKFLGGRGIAAKIYWDTVPPDTGAFDPENRLIFSTGPVAGFPGFAGYRWQVCGKSPAGKPETFSYANLGGRWGAALKYARYDALSTTGKAGKPVYLLINNDAVEIRDASHLWGRPAFEVIDIIKAELGKGVSVLTIGPAAENMVSFATLLTDEGSSGSGGLGGVMGSKRLKAVVVSGDKRPKAADPERLRRLSRRVKELRKVNFCVDVYWDIPGVTKPAICHGCGIGCGRQTYSAENGRSFKHFCQSAFVYIEPVMKYYGQWNEAALLGNRLCDTYGLDTSVMLSLINWLCACHGEGLLGEISDELGMSGAGSGEFIEALTRKISFREGFGDILAGGTLETAEYVGERAKAILSGFISTREGEIKDYDPRLIPTTALLYATEPRRPIQQLHEPSIIMMMWLKWLRGDKGAFFTSEDFRSAADRFWGSEVAADYTTFEGKALAAKKIQDRTYAKESLILCDFTWPMIWADYAGGHVGDPTLESRIYSAITGKELDETGLNRIGERIFNLQRAILLRQGWEGRKDDILLDYIHREPLKQGEIYFDPECLVLGNNNEVVSKKGSVLKREDFEQMKSDYYELRGWDVESGSPKESTLVGLGLGDVAEDLNGLGLVKKG
jgi:aldehyde:ferredoxin oxidoreductase